MLTGSHAEIAYQEFSEKIETLCKWFCIALFFTGVFCALSILIFSIVNYYILDLGEKSFFLMFSTVYVRLCDATISYISNKMIYNLFILFQACTHSTGEHDLDTFWHGYLK